jgi:hypothetical protein
MRIEPCGDSNRAEITMVWRLEPCGDSNRAEITTVWRLEPCGDSNRAEITTVRKLEPCGDSNRVEMRTVLGFEPCADHACYLTKMYLLSELHKVEETAIAAYALPRTMDLSFSYSKTVSVRAG